MKARDDYYARMQEQADRAFAKHRIVDAKPGHWFLRGEQSAYWFEVISLRNGSLFVGGDIDFVVFGFYSAPSGIPPEEIHERKVRWMGEHKDVSYYVVQKASIGTCADTIVYARDRDVAKEDLKRALVEAVDQETHDAIEIALQLVEDESFEEAERHLYEENAHEAVSWPLGRVVSPRVIYAWRALATLVRELDRAKAPVLQVVP